MRYWLTTHWPPRKGEENKYCLGIWLKDGKENVGSDINKGDIVLFYELKTGRAERRLDSKGNKVIVPCNVGKQGIVKIGKIKESLHACADKSIEKYTDGSEAWWRWNAEADLITRSGFVPRIKVSEVLNFKSNYPYKGFGKGNSGLKQISKEQFEKLLGLFKQNLKNKQIKSKPKKSKSKKQDVSEYESKAHRDLKYYVAQNPSKALKEEGLSKIDIEYLFPTNDKADVVLEDKFGRIVGVEVELDVKDDDNEGPLQSIKYRRMLEWEFNRCLGDSRSFLVANRICKKIKEKCKKYGIEHFEIPQLRVNRLIEDSKSR